MTRFAWIDSLKGIGILMVIIGHMKIPHSLSLIIYSFHMPLFFVISGFLFNELKYKDNQKRLIYNKVSSLLWPFFTFTFILLIVNLLLEHTNNMDIIPYIKTVLKELFFLNDSINTPLWFLTALFSTELLFSSILTINSKIKNIILFTIVIIGFINAYYFGIKFFLNIHIAMIGLLFFAIGYYSKISFFNNDFTLKISFFNSNFIFKILILLFIFLILVFNNQKIDMYSMDYGNPFIFVLSAFIGTIILFGLIFHYQKLKYINGILEYFGKNSLALLVMHQIVPIISKDVIGVLPFRLDRLLSVLLLLLSVELISRYLPFFLKLNIKVNHD